MRRFLIVLASYVLGFLPYAAIAQEQGDKPLHRFYAPERPKNGTLYHISGILTDYGHGNSASSLCIKPANGKIECFFTSLDVNFDGKSADCDNPGSCNPMPSGFVLGKTRVTVTYWYAQSMNAKKQAKVTDQVDSLK